MVLIEAAENYLAMQWHIIKTQITRRGSSSALCRVSAMSTAPERDEATVATLRERGLEVSDPKLGTDRSWQAWITDPDGNRIELHHYTAESKQAPHLER